MSDHVMDRYPERFGWRIWQLDESRSRLLSPLYKGRMRRGKRFFEAECVHQPVLGGECWCGMYYVPDRHYFLSWFVKDGLARSVTGDFPYAAATFGVAAGPDASDPQLPEDARRTTRYTVLFILLFEKSAAGGKLQNRYGVNVRMVEGVPDVDVLAEIEQAARAECRDMDDSARFFTELCDEPDLHEDGHITDRFPERFGWRLWRLEGYEARLTSPSLERQQLEGDYRPPTMHREYVEAVCSHGSDVPSPDCGCGIHYWTTVTYLRTHMDMLIAAETGAGYPPPRWVATFGVADGRVEGDIQAGLAGVSKRTSRYRPLALYVSTYQKVWVPKIQARFPNADLIMITDTYTLRDAERDIRTRLHGVNSLEEIHGV